jgi:hypothetical protein
MLISIAYYNKTGGMRMVKKSKVKMEERLRRLKKELGRCGPATRGSVVLIGAKTKQYYLSVNVKGRTRLVFLGKKRVDQAREYLRNYWNILDIVEKMTHIIIKMLRKADSN